MLASSSNSSSPPELPPFDQYILSFNYPSQRYTGKLQEKPLNYLTFTTLFQLFFQLPTEEPIKDAKLDVSNMASIESNLVSFSL